MGSLRKFLCNLWAISRYSLLLCLLASLGSSMELSKPEQGPESSVTMHVHNVGQGNFISLELIDPIGTKQPQYMIVDIGTSSYMGELKYEGLKEKESKPSTKFFVKDTIKPQGMAEREPKKIKSDTPKKNLKIDELLKSKRQLFSPSQAGSINIKTLIITHPDEDHYNKVKEFFTNTADRVENIIIGGRIERYDAKFREWLNTMAQRKSNIYIPSREGDNYAKHDYTPYDYTRSLFGKAVDFGDNIKVGFLSVNPSHWQGKSKTLRSTLETDDNSDSLVIKIQNGKSSAILTGDATNIVTNRILDNYAEKPEFLNTNVLVVPHHGSGTLGYNTPELIEALKPEYCFVSHGHYYGHPHPQAYANWIRSPRLQYLTPAHEVLVGKVLKDPPLPDFAYEPFKEGSLHKTNKGIFSTFSSGTLTASLLKEGGIKIKTEINGEITLGTLKEIIESKKAVTKPTKEEEPENSEEDVEADYDEEDNVRVYKKSSSHQ